MDGNKAPTDISTFNNNAYTRKEMDHAGIINIPYGVYLWQDEGYMPGYTESVVVACITNGQNP